MKNFKRVLSLALAALMVIGGLVVAPVDAKADGTYNRVYDIEDITEGGDMVIVVKFHGNYYALPNANSNKLSTIVTIDPSAITESTLTVGTLPVWTTTEGTTYNSVKLSYTKEGTTNYLGWKSSADFNSDADEWRVEYGSEEGLFRFVAKDSEKDSSVRVISLQSKENDATPNRFGPYAYSYISKGSDVLQNKYYYGCEFMVYKSGTVTASNAVTYPQDIPAIQNPTDDTVIDAAYKAMYDGVKLEGEYTITGIVSAEATASNKVATVNLKVGTDEKLLQCYKLNCGEITTEFAANYIVKVKGTLSYYNGKIQISNGELISYEAPAVIPEPVLTTPEKIVDAAYEHMINKGSGNLTDSGNGNTTFELEGKVIAVNTGYGNNKISVTIVIDGKEDKPIQCYNMKAGASGLDVSKVDVGDTIKAKGSITYYNTTVEFASGCTLEAYTASTDTTTYKTEAEILAAASKLEVGYGLAGKQTLTGIVTNVDTAYTKDKGVSVTIKVGDTSVKVYRMFGTGADLIDKDDTITVTGNLMMYKENTIEFVENCALDSYTLAETDTPEDTVEKTGDMNTAVGLILFAGVACLAVAFVSKKKMA